jgi:2-polyprenyl-6-methoxyphenol hydroxylase-like FAD-dependent oxidoreductase
MPDQLTTRCCIAGGGPAGMMLGYLLARAGVDVVVLEKHGDFLRDFRGDTVHPSTLEVLHELGLLQDFLKRPHQELSQMAVEMGGQLAPVGDLSHLPTQCKFIAFMPQWEFLNFLAESAKIYPSFHLRMNAEAVDLIEGDGQVRGVRVRTQTGDLEVRAELTVAADGRTSVVREKSGLEVITLGAPMDVLWLRLSRRPGDPGRSLGRVEPGKFLVLLDRGDYWQCGFVIPKGTLDRYHERGLQSFRDEIIAIAPFFRDRVAEIRSWNDVKLLTVTVDRLRQWYRPGLLCIGDAAHAMSPIGGVGINLAVQDAVASANILVKAFAQGAPTADALRKIEERRTFPTRATQRMQTIAQNRVITPLLQRTTKIEKLPLPLKLLRAFPFLRRIPARVIGMGFRPEHVDRALLKRA